MSINYVKIFDLIPQAVALALALELGTDPSPSPRPCLGIGAGHGPFPQALARALALELGRDPGLCQALGAMSGHLCCAFKMASSLVAWWRATNGTLQGCPLSMIFVNVLALF